jgi:hypothetical protein
VVCLGLVVWKLNGYRGSDLKGICPMCGECEDTKHISLGHNQTTGWKVKLESKKLLNYH